MASGSIPARTTPRRQGRPRSQKARSAILTAAAELIDEKGLRAISVDAIAGRASVSKATIYRWWPSKGSLALEIFLDQVLLSQRPLPDQGDLRKDLLAHISAVVRSYGKTATGKLLANLIAELPADPELARDLRNRVIQPLRLENRLIFERAAARGELSKGTDIDIAMDMIYGAIWERLLVRRSSLNDRFASSLVDVALTGLTSQPALRSSRNTRTSSQ